MVKTVALTAAVIAPSAPSVRSAPSVGSKAGSADPEENAISGGSADVAPAMSEPEVIAVNDDQVARFNAQMEEFGLIIDQDGKITGNEKNLDAAVEAMVATDNVEILDLFALGKSPHTQFYTRRRS